MITRAEINRWLAQPENLKEADARYQKTKWKLSGLAHERRVRHLLLAVAADAKPADKAQAREKLEKLYRHAARLAVAASRLWNSAMAGSGTRRRCNGRPSRRRW